MILIDIYADEGISGTLMDKRDEFKRLLKDCKNRKIDRVLVKSVTRFARNSLECKQMEDAAMIEITTQGNKERIREEIIELSQRIVALRNEKSIIEEKMTTAKTRNEELSRFSKELSLYNADCSEITDNKLRRIIQEVRIKKDHTIVIELKNGMLLEEAL